MPSYVMAAVIHDKQFSVFEISSHLPPAVVYLGSHFGGGRDILFLVVDHLYILLTLNLREQGTTKKLFYACNRCKYKEEVQEKMVHENHIISTTTTSLDMIQNDVVDDPTLQRSKDQVEESRVRFRAYYLIHLNS